MNESHWKTEAFPRYPAVEQDLRCGCLVIGGGLCGVLTAYLLGKRGIDTALIEKTRLGNGKTAGTTAKATVCHGLACSRITRTSGREAAEAYAAANRDGLRLLRELLLEDMGEPAASCRLSDFFLYSVYGERRIAEELRCMTACGIDCEPVTGSSEAFELPLPVRSAVRVRDQLCFHPPEAVHSIAARTNAAIFEETEAVSVVKTAEGFTVKCAGGHAIRAAKLIITTNYPILTPRNLSFLKLYGETTYAAALANAPALRHMYFGIDGGYAYRSHENTLIVSGERHRTAPAPNAAARLTEEAVRLFPDAVPLAAWSNNDCYTHDGLPYVGSVGDGMLLATGFNGWGMTNAAACALMLSYLAAGETPRNSPFFAPSRRILKSGGDSLLHHVGISVSGMAKNLSVPAKTTAELPRGAAAIVSHRGERAGVFRDEEGRTHAVRPRCPHLGCALTWNPAAMTWDCPCHGSRFDTDGGCICGPASESITPKDGPSL